MQLFESRPAESVPQNRDLTASRASGLEASEREYESYRRDDLVDDSVFRDRYDYDVSFAPESESPRVARSRSWTPSSGGSRRSPPSTPSPLYILLIPSKYDASEVDGFAATDAEAQPLERRRRLSDLAAASAARHGIPHLDLFDAFWQERARSLYFLADDAHWNDAAQALAADLTARDLLQRGWPSSSP